ncbi:MAG: hypothetical protein BroJett015_13440 [Chloroflexota bacterium]|nr:hypothetical protein [Chloroflexota bacterium]GIK55681.1 MAG: hypothetical protein BroJett015_13440 [Chloroflexota bacterium]
MLTILYLILAIVFAYLVWQAARIYQAKNSSYTLLLLIVLIGLLYDVLVILAGRFLGEGVLLERLNAGRYAIHALITPALIVFGFGVLRLAGVPWAQGRAAHTVVCLFATALIILGLYSDVLAFVPASRTVMDTLRYVNVGGIKGPPVPALLTIIFLIAAGFSLWRQTGWWLLAGSALLMFVAAALGMGRTFFIGNIGEVVLGLGCMLTARKFLT